MPSQTVGRGREGGERVERRVRGAGEAEKQVEKAGPKDTLPPRLATPGVRFEGQFFIADTGMLIASQYP